ncbi:methyl-accepting chemotaxis sensory transducer [Caldalkalibacillus thermarum TA2.A1]|uniref:Methyl-accepting chemotaxis protein n=1 Tax=Caldalkalibacillus thermarum (strain TA2.A1) TaxID=986075 RepID=F5L960_CALTT|nr:HAMP domain-containing methyl-accepting chemotaxis protein [Caldalkalibacillus thermarum]EGL82134.1 methyl-accepting chemotaxis sensory transducer [Caldalkalibacillus thermarum TA2.A1]QZT34962.1 methyl-accepting chemotaxis protein [Caldalkalibacillus thermarum TA2.A1]
MLRLPQWKPRFVLNKNHFLSRVKLSHKLYVSFGLVFIVLLLVGGMGLFTAEKINESTEEIYEEHLLAVADMMELARMFESLNSNVASALLGREDGMEQQLSVIKAIRQDMQHLVDDLIGTWEAEQKENLDTFITLWNYYSDRLDQIILWLEGEGNVRTGVTQRDVAISYYNSLLLPQVNTLNRFIQNWVDERKQLAQQRYMGALQFQQQLFYILLGLMGGALVIIILLSVFLSRSIQKPLSIIAERLNRLSQGDLRGEPLEIHSHDELGKLARSYNLMNESLGQLIREVLHSAEQVSATAQQLTEHTKEISAATEEVTTAIQHIASGAESQVNGAEESSNGMSEISSGIGTISTSIKTVEENAREMAQHAEQGDISIQKVKAQMQAIGQSMLDAVQVIETLKNNAAQISEISKAISDISDQTNLLALNASIEAARAGEYGRSFAVVANEVKKLADQSAQSAKEVTQLITHIQINTEQVVQQMKKVNEEFQTGQSVVATASQQFDNILSAAQHVSQQVMDISTATQQIAANSAQVVDKIKQTEHIAKEASANIQNVSASSEEQLAFMQEIQASANALSEMADNLYQLIGRFKTS